MAQQMVGDSALVSLESHSQTVPLKVSNFCTAKFQKENIFELRHISLKHGLFENLNSPTPLNLVNRTGQPGAARGRKCADPRR